jgi:hypothetical protein
VSAASRDCALDGDRSKHDPDPGSASTKSRAAHSNTALLRPTECAPKCPCQGRTSNARTRRYLQRVPLFANTKRADRATRRSGEDWFTFLERVGPDLVFERIRVLIDEWFEELPATEQAAFRPRLLSGKEATSMPAFWELYLHAALKRAGFQIAYEPALPHSSRKADYLVGSGDKAFYLEARLVGEPAHRMSEDNLVHPLTEALRQIDSSAFTLDFQISRRGRSAPPINRVTRDVEKWLSGLDRDEVRRLQSERGVRAVRPLLLTVGDWQFSFTPIPRPDHRAGTPSASGAISIFPGRSAWGDDWSRLGDALREKAKRYGDLGRPYVIALLANDRFTDTEAIANAIYGDPAFAIDADGNSTIARIGGLWGGPRPSAVSAVLSARHLVPSSVASVTPLLWRPPNPVHALSAELHFAAGARLLESGEIHEETPRLSPSEHFDLPSAWPGPERPFRD